MFNNNDVYGIQKGNHDHNNDVRCFRLFLLFCAGILDRQMMRS